MDERVSTIYINGKGFVSLKLIGDKHGLIHVLNDSISKQYAGYRLILKDLLTVKKLLTRLTETRYNGQATIEKQSMSFYAIITYGKCFAQADGRKTKLESKTSLKLLADRLKAEHKRIIDLRNKYVAHAGLEGHEQNVVVALLNPDEPKRVVEIYDNIMELVDIDSQIDDFLELTNHLIKNVREICKNKMNLIKDHLSKVDIDSIYAKAIDAELLKPTLIKYQRK